MEQPEFTLGIEEEYLIVDRETRNLVAEPDHAIFDECRKALGDQVSAEFMQCQIEVGTRPHRRVSEAIGELGTLRRSVADVAEPLGYAVIAASTHPFANWRNQSHTRKERYDGLAADIGQPVSRLLISGMHMHVGIEDDDLRIDLMNQAAYFLPHMLALSCSSPFWMGRDTQLSSYRLNVFDTLPRTGLPDQLGSYSEYARLVDHLVKCGCIEDGSKIWWDIRPSSKFPTLEQRVTDVCPLLRDVGALAALYQSLLAYLYRLRSRNQRWRMYPQTLILENRWRAQRYGVKGKMIDHGESDQVEVIDLVNEIIGLVSEEASNLHCSRELKDLRRIARDGSSAVRQRATYETAMKQGADSEEALRQVVDQLIEEFTVDCPPSKADTSKKEKAHEEA